MSAQCGNGAQYVFQCCGCPLGPVVDLDAIDTRMRCCTCRRQRREVSNGYPISRTKFPRDHQKLFRRHERACRISPSNCCRPGRRSRASWATAASESVRDAAATIARTAASCFDVPVADANNVNAWSCSGLSLRVIAMSKMVSAWWQLASKNESLIQINVLFATN